MSANYRPALPFNTRCAILLPRQVSRAVFNTDCPFLLSGHGPFSHLFDGKFIPLARPNCHWEVRNLCLPFLSMFRSTDMQVSTARETLHCRIFEFRVSNGFSFSLKSTRTLQSKCSTIWSKRTTWRRSSKSTIFMKETEFSSKSRYVDLRAKRYVLNEQKSTFLVNPSIPLEMFHCEGKYTPQRVPFHNFAVCSTRKRVLGLL